MSYIIHWRARKPNRDGKQTQRLVPAGGSCHLGYEQSEDTEWGKHGRTAWPVWNYGGDMASTEGAIQGTREGQT